MKNNTLPRWGLFRCYLDYNGMLSYSLFRKTREEIRQLKKLANPEYYKVQIPFDSWDVDGLNVAMEKALAKLEKMGYAS